MDGGRCGPGASRKVASIGARSTAVLMFASLLFIGSPWTPEVSGDEPAPGLTAAGGSGWIPDVAVAVDGAVQESDPSITTAANGNLYMAYQANPAGNYDIFFTQSSDGGQSWSAPVTVVSTLTDEVTPSIAQDPSSGRTFVAYRYGLSGGTPIRAAYSDDLLTWNDRTVLPCGVACERPRIVSEYWNGASNVQYVALAGPISASDWNVAIARSVDDGNTWSWYESGLSASDVRYQPDITVQYGTDGIGRVYVFYRGGTAFPPTLGYAEWSSNGGVSWAPRAQWYDTVYSPPVAASAHDGSSLLLAYSTNATQVAWAQIPYPRDLTTFNGTQDVLPTPGTDPAVSVDGVGNVNTTIGGSYNLVAHDTGGGIFHVGAPVTLTSNADWSVPVTITDVGSVPSTGAPGISATTQDRTGVWQPAVAWTDERNASRDVYYTTPGAPGGIDVTLLTSPSGRQVTLDSVTRNSPAVFWVVPGLHTISVPSPQTSAGYRYTFASWSDGGAMSHVVNVTASSTYTAIFSVQVQLVLNSPYGGVSGAGWYDLDTSATISVTSPQSGPTGWRYQFTDWSGDITSASMTAVVFMDAPKTVTANWRSQVLLTIDSPYAGVSGAGWYNLGATATATAQPVVAGAPGTRHPFAAWTGDMVSSNLVLTVLMNNPKTLIAVWLTEYELTVTTAHGNASGSGWYSASQIATVTVQSTQVTEGGKVWIFAGWSGDATGNNPELNVTITGPTNLTALWQESANPFLADLWIPLLLLAILAGILLVVFLMRRRKKEGTMVPATPAYAPMPLTPSPPPGPTGWPDTSQGPPPSPPGT